MTRHATVLLLAMSMPAAPLLAQTVPSSINYQGRLTDNTLEQVPIDGVVPMTFGIWTAPAGGSQLWTETWNTPGVTVTRGIFSIILGTNGTPIPASVFATGTTRYLEIDVNGETLAPRQQLGSVGWSMQAQGADTANTAITATNFTGPLAGDVTGTQGATTVARIQGRAVSAAAPSANQFLQYIGTQWTPSTFAYVETDPKVGALTTGRVPYWGGTTLLNGTIFDAATGLVGIGAAGTTNRRLDVSSGTMDAVYGHSNNVGGFLGYETNFSIGTPPQSLNGSGVFASNPAAGYTSSFAQSTGSATVAANINYSNVWMASYNYVDNASISFNPSALYAQLNVTGTTLGGTQIALRGYNNRGTTTGNPGYTVGVQGVANAQFQDSIAVQGISYTDAPIKVGGYFEGLNWAGTSQAYAYVGGNDGTGLTKIKGTGTVSEIIPTAAHGRVTLTAPESPEYWYQDYGSVTLANGKAHVDLDPVLADIIVVDAKNRIRVFCTPVGMPAFNGVTVMNQTAKGFDLVELNGGTHSGLVDYQIVAKPKTNFGQGRFPQAPGPMGVKPSQEPAAAKAANQPDPAKIFIWPADHIVYGYDPADFTPVGEVVHGGPQSGKRKLADGTFSDVIVPADRRLVEGAVPNQVARQ